MKAHSESRPLTHAVPDANGGCSQLADYLQSRKEALLADWLVRARGDVAVLSDGLSQGELVDHVPKMFDALVDALRNRGSGVENKVHEVTARHTVVRWVQRYDLRAVLREVSLLRSEFIKQLFAFDMEHADLGRDARLLNVTTVHCILDDIVMDATDTFLKLNGRSDEA